jgi:hypothetical protein
VEVKELAMKITYFCSKYIHGDHEVDIYINTDKAVGARYGKPCS